MIYRKAQDLNFQLEMQCPVYKGSDLRGSIGKSVTEEGFTFPGTVSQGPSPIAGSDSSDSLLCDDLINQPSIYSLSSRKENKIFQ